MKRYKNTVCCVVSMVLLCAATVRAQVVRIQNPAEPDEERRRIRLLLDEYNLRLQGFQARGPQLDGLNVNRVVTAQVPGAWWTNTALVERLGLTDDQKAKIERTFENHRQNILSATAQLEKEELTLNRLLEAETIDRNAILSQIDRVVQARGEVERTNSAMTLEMREHLTRDQWMQLPRTSTGTGVFYGVRGGGGRGGAPAPGTTTPPPGAGGRRGGRGQ